VGAAARVGRLEGDADVAMDVSKHGGKGRLSHSDAQSAAA